MADAKHIVIAVFNSSIETLEILRELLTEEGFFPVTAHVDDVRTGKVDLPAFLRAHDPAAIVWDVPPPYAENWNLLKLIRDLPEVARRGLVITTTNERALRESVGFEGALELVGKPYDLQRLVQAIRATLDQRGP